jgi:hypothetical protein
MYQQIKYFVLNYIFFVELTELMTSNYSNQLCIFFICFAILYCTYFLHITTAIDYEQIFICFAILYCTYCKHFCTYHCKFIRKCIVHTLHKHVELCMSSPIYNRQNAELYSVFNSACLSRSNLVFKYSTLFF